MAQEDGSSPKGAICSQRSTQHQHARGSGYHVYCPRLDRFRDRFSEKDHVRLNDGVLDPLCFTVRTGRYHKRVVFDATEIYLLCRVLELV
jgi:hypothetical protein